MIDLKAEYLAISAKVQELVRLELKRHGVDVPATALEPACQVATATAVTLARKGFRRGAS